MCVHNKRKKKKTENVCSSTAKENQNNREEKKKKNPETEMTRPGSQGHARPGSHCDLLVRGLGRVPA